MKSMILILVTSVTLIGQIKESADFTDPDSVVFFDSQGKLLPKVKKSNVQLNTEIQFNQKGQWEWEGFFLGESRSAKAIISTQNGILYAGTWRDAVIFKSFDGGENWEIEVSFADSNQTHILTLFESQNGDIFAGTLTGATINAGVYKLPYGKTEWLKLPSLPEGVGSDSILFNEMVRDIVEDENGILYIAVRSIRLNKNGFTLPKGEVWKSPDGGETWLTTGEIGGSSTQYIRSLLVLGDNLYASTGNSAKGEIYKSTNNGETWEKIGGRLLQAGNNIWTLAADDNSTIYAGARYFYRLANEGENGENWEKLPSPDNSDIRVLKIGKDGSLYAGTINGNIFRSTDDGTTWEYMGDLEVEDVNNVNVFDFIEYNKHFYAATATRLISGSNNWHGVIYRNKLPIVSVTEEKSSLNSLSYSIYPNPSPRGSSVRLNIALPLGVNMTSLRIYNIIGQLVRDVDISQITSGSQTDIIIWDGRNNQGREVSYGMYILKFNIRDASGQRKKISSKLTYGIFK